MQLENKILFDHEHRVRWVVALAERSAATGYSQDLAVSAGFNPVQQVTGAIVVLHFQRAEVRAKNIAERTIVDVYSYALAQNEEIQGIRLHGHPAMRGGILQNGDDRSSPRGALIFLYRASHRATLIKPDEYYSDPSLSDADFLGFGFGFGFSEPFFAYAGAAARVTTAGAT